LALKAAVVTVQLLPLQSMAYDGLLLRPLTPLSSVNSNVADLMAWLAKTAACQLRVKVGLQHTVAHSGVGVKCWLRHGLRRTSFQASFLHKLTFKKLMGTGLTRSIKIKTQMGKPCQG
jgi:hypothetical protein